MFSQSMPIERKSQEGTRLLFTKRDRLVGSVQLGHPCSPEGFAAFSRPNEFRQGSGIGAFLTAFFSVSSTQREGLIPALNLIQEPSSTLEANAVARVCLVYKSLLLR